MDCESLPNPESIDILRILAEFGESSSSEIMVRMSVENDSNFTTRKISPLVKAGFVEKTERTRSSKQRYRITSTG